MRWNTPNSMGTEVPMPQDPSRSHVPPHLFICILFNIPCVCMLSHVQAFVTPWTVAHQAPLSTEFSRQGYWRLGCHFLLHGIFPTQGSNPQLLHWQEDFLPLSLLEVPNIPYIKPVIVFMFSEPLWQTIEPQEVMGTLLIYFTIDWHLNYFQLYDLWLLWIELLQIFL